MLNPFRRLKKVIDLANYEICSFVLIKICLGIDEWPMENIYITQLQCRIKFEIRFTSLPTTLINPTHFYGLVPLTLSLVVDVSQLFKYQFCQSLRDVAFNHR
jgi:hypothetical protein